MISVTVFWYLLLSMESCTLLERKSKETTLIWSNVSVQTSINNKDSITLLDRVTGIARSGEILVLMGASGVGKS